MNKDNSDETKNLGFINAYNRFEQIENEEVLETGDSYLDRILKGGLRRGLIHILVGDSKKVSEILLRSAVYALKPLSATRFEDKKNGTIEIGKVAYIDGTNRYNPYYISQLALSMNMNPSFILSKILIARAFNWTQMVEILEKKIERLDGVRLILIDGITSLLQVEDNENNLIFNGLKRAISGIKRFIQDFEPYMIITAPRNKKSFHKPLGGNLLTHFGCVIVEIIELERRIEYILAQHPFLPYRKIVEWKNITNTVLEKYLKWNSIAYAPIETKLVQDWRNELAPVVNTQLVTEVINAKKNWKRQNSKKSNSNVFRTYRNLTLDFFIQ